MDPLSQSFKQTLMLSGDICIGVPLNGALRIAKRLALELSPTLTVSGALFHNFTPANNLQMEKHDLPKMPFYDSES